MSLVLARTAAQAQRPGEACVVCPAWARGAVELAEVRETGSPCSTITSCSSSSRSQTAAQPARTAEGLLLPPNPSSQIVPHNVARDDDAAASPVGGRVPQQVLGTAEEDARLGVVLEALSLLALNVRPGAAAEHAQGRVVGLTLVHHLVGRCARGDQA
jgi:hypothetical protein